ncbi:MAG: aspartate-semialdehyde dehydrogenase, partial [Longimicrobiales bacterium]
VREILAERNFPIAELRLFASARSAGTTLPWGGAEITVEDASTADPSGLDIALFSAGATTSRALAPRFAEAGVTVVDNSSAWRMDPDVPLVVPEVNAARARERPKGIIANPNCSTIQTVVALEAIRRVAGLRRVVASTYQSVSGAGQKGLAALRAELAGEASATPFPAPIAGNAIPSIGPRLDDGWTEEEEKMRNESRRILELPGLAVAATCVRVPVEVGHSVSVTIETERPLSVDEAKAALRAMPGICVPEGRDPVARDAAGRDEVFVGRVRADHDVPNTLHLWVVADNLRKGAATNAVQIAERVADE